MCFFTSDPSSSCVLTSLDVSRRKYEEKQNQHLKNADPYLSFCFIATSVCLTYILFSSFAFLLPFCISHFSTETGNVIVAFFRIPLLSTLLASKAKLLVLIFSLGTGAVQGAVTFQVSNLGGI